MLVLILWTWIMVGHEARQWPLALPMLGSVPLAFALAVTMRWLETQVATRFFHSTFAASADRRALDYGVEETLVVRGEFDRAADAYLVRTLAHPDDLEARFRLADLHWRRRRDYASAEQVYLELRARELSRTERARVDRSIIDLYEASGDRERLKAELARTARAYPGTDFGRGAARQLRELDGA
jgi:hypothetical protein